MTAFDELSNDAFPPHLFALIWWLLMLLIGFLLYISLDLGFLRIVFERDQSHLTKAIALLTIASSLHAAWFIVRYSVKIQDVTQHSSASGLHQDSIKLEIAADGLRAPVEIGWFMVDLAIRLGLAGTIIGFILIFGSLTGESIVGEDALRDLLLSMSGGMGTALFTTLTGLAAATCLSFQYLLLGRQTEHLIAAMIISSEEPRQA
jgi:biopolymer transport protein ExbB/TolQ